MDQEKEYVSGFRIRMSRLEIEAVSSFLKYTHAPEVSLFLKEF
jgi:hypothetical protein